MLVGFFAISAAALVAPGAAPLPKENKARHPWTTSRVVGSPDPPHPYRSERAFPKLSFRNGVHIEACPEGGRLFVVEQDGKIVSFVPSPDVKKADPVLDLPRQVKGCKPGKVVRKFGAAYAMTFHPKFARNRHCYVCYMLETHEKKGLNAIERVSRFTVSKGDPPRCDPGSEKVILEWRTEPGGHNGGCLRFGPDGFLYVSMGDAAAPSPPDGYDTGQDLTDFLSTILRIDVNREENNKPYAVPKDNPFVKVADARPEIWAYGFRNPWKMSFDRRSGELWVGDVGWELWEMVYRVRKGGNYGWSVMEGPQAVRPKAKRGPTPILPPAIEFPHSEAASITGGFVYRGSKFKDLAGCYVCGDWMTGKLWATRFDGEKKVSHREIAQGREKIVAFAEDRDGELYWLDHGDDGGIYTLAVNRVASHDPAKFPRKLSETGLFASVAKHEPAPGVVPYAINAEPWMDHATAERLVAVPGNGTVKVHDSPQRVPGTAWFTSRYFFPSNSVLVKTMGVESERGKPRTRRRVETQLLHFDGHDWRGYTYRWNADQNDAELVAAAGAEAELTSRDPDAPGGVRGQTWTFGGRGSCLQCHNSWAGTVLGFTVEQLGRRDSADQLTQLARRGLLTRVDGKGRPLAFEAPLRAKSPYPSPHDSAGDLAARARAYLHVNCAHCHQSSAGGTALIDLRFSDRAADLRAIGQPPVQGTFAIADARLIAPGDPYRSVLYYRMAKTGPGRMPHVGSEVVDRAGLALLHDWIEKLPRKEQGPARDEEADRLKRLRAGGDSTARSRELDKLLSTTSGALRLARALDTDLPADQRRQVVARATRHTEASVQSLFERFLPAEQRVKRLGSLVRPQTVLERKGDPARGKELFFRAGATQCAACHKIGGKGSTLGPDLSAIGKKYTRAKLLESILDPSKEIDKQYVAHMLRTTKGQLLTGVLVKRDEKEVVLRDAQDKEHRVPATQVEHLEASKISLMPEQLLRDLSAQQAADLLDYLAQLK